jgi:hypothetical protein
MQAERPYCRPNTTQYSHSIIFLKITAKIFYLSYQTLSLLKPAAMRFLQRIASYSLITGVFFCGTSCNSESDAPAVKNPQTYSEHVFIDTPIKLFDTAYNRKDTALSVKDAAVKAALSSGIKDLAGTWAFSDFFDESKTAKLAIPCLDSLDATSTISGQITYYPEGYSKLYYEIIFRFTDKETNEEKSVKLAIRETSVWKIIKDSLQQTTTDNALTAENDLARQIIGNDSLSFEILRPLDGEKRTIKILHLTASSMEVEDEDGMRMTFRKK